MKTYTYLCACALAIVLTSCTSKEEQFRAIAAEWESVQTLDDALRVATSEREVRDKFDPASLGEREFNAINQIDSIRAAVLDRLGYEAADQVMQILGESTEGESSSVLSLDDIQD